MISFVTSFDSQPSSTSGTRSGQAADSTSKDELIESNSVSYAPDAIVPYVPITPILPFLVMFAAKPAPGFITPMIGISNSFCNRSRASAEAVLQAIIIAFTFLSERKYAS